MGQFADQCIDRSILYVSHFAVEIPSMYIEWQPLITATKGTTELSKVGMGFREVELKGAASQWEAQGGVRRKCLQRYISTTTETTKNVILHRRDY